MQPSEWSHGAWSLSTLATPRQILAGQRIQQRTRSPIRPLLALGSFERIDLRSRPSTQILAGPDRWPELPTIQRPALPNGRSSASPCSGSIAGGLEDEHASSESAQQSFTKALTPSTSAARGCPDQQTALGRSGSEDAAA